MNWRIGLTLALLLTAAVSGWSVWKNRAIVVDKAATPGRSDFVLHQFEVIALDEQGKESFTVRAPKLVETPGAKSMELETPLFLMPDATEGGYWQVRSQTGWISDTQDEVRLKGAVEAISDPAGTRHVKLASEQLTVFPRKRTMTTPASVTITQPGSILRGVGMDVDLNSKAYVIHAQVRSRYDRSLR